MNYNDLWILMTEEDHYMYVKMSKDNFVISSLYMDDILLAGNNIEFVQIIKEQLLLNFEMKDMNEASYILELKIYKDCSRKILALSQESYIRRILEKFKMDKCKLMDTPISKEQTLNLEMCPKTSKERNEMT